MIDKIKRLSYSSIKLLNENQKKWFNQYILWIRDNEYHDYFVVGKAFHLILECFNKTGNKDINIWYEYIQKEAKDRNHKEPQEKEFNQLDALYNNYFDGTETRSLESELNINMILGGFPFIAILDAVHSDKYVEDYKAVSSFNNPDTKDWLEKLLEYYIQWWFYMIAYKVHYWEYPKFVRFTEIKKSIASLKYYTKDKILDMVRENNVITIEEEKLTKDRLIEKYRLCPKWKNIIDVPFSEELVNRCNDLVINAVEIIKSMNDKYQSQPFKEDEIVKNLIVNK